MFIVVGLGNPGREYARTRHNVGFDVIDVLSEKHHIQLTKNAMHGQIGEGFVGGENNGMRSVIGLLGRQDFPRLRVGVGKKPEGWELADWVLSHYQTEADRKTQFDAFLRAADVVDDLMKNGLESAMRMANAPA